MLVAVATSIVCMCFCKHTIAESWYTTQGSKLEVVKAKGRPKHCLLNKHFITIGLTDSVHVLFEYTGFTQVRSETLRTPRSYSDLKRPEDIIKLEGVQLVGIPNHQSLLWLMCSTCRTECRTLTITYLHYNENFLV